MKLLNMKDRENYKLRSQKNRFMEVIIISEKMTFPVNELQ